MQNYTGGFEFHPKVSPFPLVLKPKMGKAAYRNPVPFFRQVFLETWNGNHNETELQQKKTNNIFVGYIANTSHQRSNIPSGRKLDYVDYLRDISRTKYVISPDGDHPDCHRHYESIGLGAIPITQPDGDHPDCHRHYESIGLGAIPITQLDPYFYSHLREGHIIYKNSIWNLTELNSSLPMMQPRCVNRNMIFEEYWMEYMERIVGRPLRWWDVNQNAKATLNQLSLSSVPIYNLTN
ncbi:hypothetical protein FRACYDRAFT_255289 [Fragilariopsis cylindrus CCMP1102]|uniref:Exostosin GT47 domain-containing protein n=1 Tax=Fragilariopsis cylindrus CCMP1102 TaxID=635003 RepID=A0A1E7EK22_9STRA|nr:hypothetical protein FRACYDRAFT_255289 [Fragilariopsis cylindrus CCMP1102]|eukprot:OEU06279.1 hypothetical protein FRACYDRAFT_255289 [Fragilariopsis cylindrus CCMP1102]